MIHSPNSFDVAIIGGGILGLWAARHAIKRGQKVCLVEKRKIGAGASGGFLGALMPHMPDGWDAKKQFQYEGLSTLPQAIAELEADTGHDCGYKMCGRIIPLPHEKMLQHMPIRTKGSQEFWGEGYTLVLRQAQDEGISTGSHPQDNTFPCSKPSVLPQSKPSVLLQPELVEGWVNPDIAQYGIQYDTFSARVNPRAYVAALEMYVRPRAEVIENTEALTLSLSKGEGGAVHLSNGDKISAGKIIIANGYEAYPLLQPLMGEILNGGKPIGRGVKGQAVLVEFEHEDNLPIVYHDGVYVVPHANNRVAIGSTSRKEWMEPFTFDDADMEFYEKAISYVPALKNAPIIDKWAAVRPRNTLDGKGTDPFFGPVPGQEELTALVGGFKITLGVAHVAGL